jgi:hypothetical protein
LIALKAISADSKEHSYEYDFKPGNASNPDVLIPIRSAFNKARTLSFLFRNRRLPREELKEQCRVKGIDYRRTVCDMSVR